MASTTGVLVLSLQEWQWLAQFGFSAVVAGYVLIRLEPLIREQTKAITLLTIVVARATGQDMDSLRHQFGFGGEKA